MPVKTLPESKEARAKRLSDAIDRVDWPHDEVKSIISNAMRNFEGNLQTFTSAVGCMFLCMYMGRRVMQVVFDSKTIKKYERLLDINFKDLPYIHNITENSERSNGFRWASDFHNFWDAVRIAKPPENDMMVSPESIPDSRIAFPSDLT